jgi:Concanavalin A-like lectin/glucanases superfamily
MRASRSILLVSLALTNGLALADKKDGTDAIRAAVSLYASFDEAVKADIGGGTLSLSTRSNHATEKAKFVVEKGYDSKAFRIARGKGIAGGALECVEVLPRNGRIFFPAKGNLAFDKGGWGGSLSLWMKTDPDELLKTKFCDPIQITQKGANDGGLWFDFNADKPRALRMGAFPALLGGAKGTEEGDPKAQMVWVRKPGFAAADWHHVGLTWRNLDTGKADAVVTLYIDGKRVGAVEDRPLAMQWDVEKVGIYVAINYIGLLDELALFKRELTAEEIELLHARPGLLTGLKRR